MMAAAAAAAAAHPPYQQMIIRAIADLNEKKGSSKRAIAKYIDAAFSNLPHTHAALLAHHLRRLKKKGLVQMVKHSYRLPKHPLKNAKPVGMKRGRGRPPKLRPLGVAAVGGVVPKRGPGRPPKPRPAAGDAALLPRRPRGRPRKEPLFVQVTSAVLTTAAPVAVAVNGELPAKLVAAPAALVSPRPRGRPRKLLPDGTPAAAASPASEKRPRGRPRNAFSSGATGPGPAAASPGTEKRPRGRPKKIGSPAATERRPRGRPKKTTTTVDSSASPTIAPPPSTAEPLVRAAASSPAL